MKPEPNLILSVSNLAIGFPERLIIPSINASVYQGELVSVIGHNGTGKSTLLRTLAGIRKKLSGEIRINGKDTSLITRKEFASMVGYVSTEQVNAPDMKVYDLVALGRFAYTNWMGSITGEDKKIIFDSIDKVGLSRLIYSNIGELSDGEKQRAMIARVLAQDTSILVMDEPTAFLDLRNRYEIIHLLQSLAVSGKKTIILSTHDLQSALGESDKIWLLTDGALEEGAPEDLVLKGSFDNLFGESLLKFRKSDGNFYPVREEKESVCIRGEGLMKQWTIRAMKRMGFRIKENVAVNEITITSDEKKNEWTLQQGKINLVFNSVYSMVFWIKRNHS